jgi:hypothetical protein
MTNTVIAFCLIFMAITGEIIMSGESATFKADSISVLHKSEAALSSAATWIGHEKSRL